MPEQISKSFATALVERALIIPPEPAKPAGSADSVKVFRAAPGFYRYRLIQWLGTQAVTGVGLSIGVIVAVNIPRFTGYFVLEIIELFGLLSFLAQIPVTYLMVHLDYQLRWYIVTDRSLRIREGLVRTDEKTMSFANVQNVAIRQGPLQRFLEIADVEVRTAGGGGGAQAGGKNAGHEDMHLGYFRGVSNAEEIRDAILDRVRRLRDTGLGDPDADHGRPPHGESAALVAAREVLEAARALRSVAR